MNAYTVSGLTLAGAAFILVVYSTMQYNKKKKEKKKGGKSKAKKSKKRSKGGRYAHINFKPTKGMVAAAKRGIKLRKEYGRGGLTTRKAGELGIGSGYQRARDIAEGQKLSPKTVRMMKGFFDRHSKNKKYHDKKPPSNALISWLLWGGDPGESWANKIVRQMNKADEKGK